MRRRARVQLVGEVTGVGRSKVQAYFELRDAEGAVPCAIWLNDLEKAGLPEGGLRDGAEVVIGGGPDYYPGGGQASPSFSFRATHVRLAGEGDLLARLEALRKQLRAEGLFELQKQLPRPPLPRTIGVVTAEGGAARRDLLAGLERRGWARDGRLGLRAGPGPPRRAGDRRGDPGPRRPARGRGDRRRPRRRQPRRPLGLLRRDALPHGGDAAGAGVSAVGHERDSTLIDDVAAVACSTPTHAAEAVVPLDCCAARGGARAQRRRPAAGGGAAPSEPAPATWSPSPAGRPGRCGASGSRSTRRRARSAPPRNAASPSAAPSSAAFALVVLERAARRAAGPEASSRREALRRADGRAPRPRPRAHPGARLRTRRGPRRRAGDQRRAAALAAGRVKLRFADGRVGAQMTRRRQR